MPIIAIALFNGVIATYLAVCQIGFHGQAWDPFFGDGTQRVLTSSVSRAFPVSDAALGAAAYFLEALFGFMGDERRWRTKPWLALTFALLVLPLFFVSIGLMILQPVVVHAWCTLCLVCAAGMLLMVPLALDEVIAAAQFLENAARQKRPLWHTFWHGGRLTDPTGGGTYPAGGRSDQTGAFAGFSPTLPLMISAAIGIAMLFLPAAMGDIGEAADSLYITGALVITISMLACAEIARAAHWLLLGCAAWLLTVSPFSMLGATNATKVVEVGAGCLLFACSYWRGRIRQDYNGWNRFLA
jgi:hypothetical protein